MTGGLQLDVDPAIEGISAMTFEKCHWKSLSINLKHVSLVELRSRRL